MSISSGVINDGLKILADTYLSTYYYTCPIEEIVIAGTVFKSTRRMINGGIIVN